MPIYLSKFDTQLLISISISNRLKEVWMSQHSKPMATQYSKVVCCGAVAILSLQSIWDKL
jgi:hypothetical protein